MPLDQVQNLPAINGHAYRVIIEKPNHEHPQGFKVGVYTGEPEYTERVWIRTGGRFDTAETLFQEAKEQARAHADKR